MDDKNKRFVAPEALLIAFYGDDIIRTSGGMTPTSDGDWNGQDGDQWPLG